jgi:putative transposase
MSSPVRKSQTSRPREPKVVAVKLALDLDSETRRILDGQSKIASWLWNQLLEEANTTRARLIAAGQGQSSKDDLALLYSKYGLRDFMVDLKPAKPWLRCLHSSTTKNVALRLSRAIKDTVRGQRKTKLGWPNFNHWGWEWFSLEYDEPLKGYSFSPGKISLSLGTDDTKKHLSVELKLHEPLPTFVQPGNVRALRLVKEHGRYFAVITVIRQMVAQKALPAQPKMIALDPGHINPLTGFNSDGGVIEITRPFWLRRQDQRIEEVQAKRDHCRRKSVQITTPSSGKTYWQPSRRWRFYNDVLQRLRHQRQEQIKHWCYEVGNRLFAEHDLVSMGNYSPRGGGRSTGERRSMNNQSLVGSMRRTLAWLAERSGKQFISWDERNSTKTCHSCNSQMPDSISPKIRVWTCPVCQTVNHRDANAAQNGLDRTKNLVSLPCSGHQEISSWRTWRLTEAGVVQITSTPESALALAASS